jgi:hypothetical protein
MVAELQMQTPMTKINYFVTIVIGCDTLERLVGDSMVALLTEVVGVAQVEALGLRSIILPQLRLMVPH